MIKAIFIDIDGTLRDSNRNLSLRTINAVKKLLEILNIPKEDTIAIGDDNNDL